MAFQSHYDFGSKVGFDITIAAYERGADSRKDGNDGRK